MRPLRLASAAFFSTLLLLAAPAAATVAASQTSPDGRWLLQVADFRVHQVFELWATPTAGGARRQIGRTVPALQDVRNDLVISADSLTVAYVQGETASGSQFRIWSTPIDRLAGHVISHAAPQSGVGFDLPIEGACSDREVKFRSDPILDENFAWFVVPITGGPIRPWDGCRIFVDGFEGGSTGGWR